MSFIIFLYDVTFGLIKPQANTHMEEDLPERLKKTKKVKLDREKHVLGHVVRFFVRGGLCNRYERSPGCRSLHALISW